MTNTEQNIACAVLEGTHTVTAIMPNYYEVADANGKHGKFGEGFHQCDIGFCQWPDYVKDLNACARLVGKLTKNQVALYHLSLLAMCNGRSTAIDATAPQRVVAILRATGKRKDA